MSARNHPLRLDLPIRTSERKRDGVSPSQQRQMAEQILSGTPHEIVAVHDSGRSESGKTMDRAALLAIRERVRAGLTDGVIVGYLDRLGRAPIEESMTFVRELIGDGGVLVAADWGPEPIDLTDPNAEDMLVFRMQMNRSQWAKSRARYKQSQQNAIEAGKFVGPTPFGFRRVKGVLFEHPTYGPIVREAFRRAARDGLHAAIAYLSVRAPERPTRDGGLRASNWNTDSVRKLLRSRAYLGESWYWTADEYGDPLRVVSAKRHDMLTDEATHAAAQTPPQSRRANGEYLLSGLVRCACGAPLVGQYQRNVDQRRYRCSLYGEDTGVHSSCGADQLHAHVRAELRSVVARREVRDRLTPAGLDDARDRWERAKAELRAYAKATSALGDGFAEGAADREHDVDTARTAYRALSARATRSERFPEADQLDSDAAVQRALRLLADDGLALVLSRGRALVADRVGWVDHGEAVTGALAA